jgi:hypothetical protein
MKYCPNCRETVNAVRCLANIGIAELWTDYCEKCSGFICSGFDHKPIPKPEKPLKAKQKSKKKDK